MNVKTCLQYPTAMTELPLSLPTRSKSFFILRCSLPICCFNLCMAPPSLLSGLYCSYHLISAYQRLSKLQPRYCFVYFPSLLPSLPRTIVRSASPSVATRLRPWQFHTLTFSPSKFARSCQPSQFTISCTRHMAGGLALDGMGCMGVRA